MLFVVSAMIVTTALYGYRKVAKREVFIFIILIGIASASLCITSILGIV